MELLDYHVGPAANDVYGKMFYYLRDLLVDFQHRLAKTSVALRLSCVATAELTDWAPALQFDRPFDRIEVGRLFLGTGVKLTLAGRLPLGRASFPDPRCLF